MAPLRSRKSCRKLQGADFFYVGSVGQEPNWFARPVPFRVSEACRKSFVSALGEVRREFDLLPPKSEDRPLAAVAACSRTFRAIQKFCRRACPEFSLES
jgi:hypothetical protein